MTPYVVYCVMPPIGCYTDRMRVIQTKDIKAVKLLSMFGRLLPGDSIEFKLEDNDENCTRPCPADKQGMRQPGGRYDKARKILSGEKK